MNYGSTAHGRIISAKMRERREKDEIIQNMVFVQVKNEYKASDWQDASEPRFVRVAKAVDDTSSFRFSTTSAGMVEFYLSPGSFVAILKKNGRDLHKDRYNIPSFADPKFEPQKIIDIVLECMKRLSEMNKQYREVHQRCYYAVTGAMSEFDKIMEKIK